MIDFAEMASDFDCAEGLNKIKLSDNRKKSKNSAKRQNNHDETKSKTENVRPKVEQQTSTSKDGEKVDLEDQRIDDAIRLIGEVELL